MNKNPKNCHKNVGRKMSPKRNSSDRRKHSIFLFADNLKIMEIAQSPFNKLQTRETIQTKWDWRKGAAWKMSIDNGPNFFRRTRLGKNKESRRQTKSEEQTRPTRGIKINASYITNFSVSYETLQLILQKKRYYHTFWFWIEE